MEESPDVTSDITPEDFDGEKETPKAESSPETEAKAPVEETPKAESKEESPETDKVTEPKATNDTETQKAEEPEKTPAKAEVRKTELNTEIRDLVARRNVLKAQVEKANAEAYQPATEDELVEEGLSTTEAKVEALRQEIEVSKYNERVADAQLTIGQESNQVLQDFPIFNPDSPEYDKELAEEAAELLDSNLIRDPNTEQVIGSNVSPYKLYKTIARASGLSTIKGQLKGQQDTEQMLANADSPAGTAPVKEAKDPVIALWEDDKI